MIHAVHAIPVTDLASFFRGSSPMRLSILTALFNCLPHTQAMLASLRATLPRDLDWELVFADDGSTDGTRDWLAATAAADPRMRVVLQPENRGFAAANNRAASLATGDVLALLNNDLVLAPGWLEPMVRVLESHPDAALVGNVQTSVESGQIHHTGLFINAHGKPEHDRAPPAAAGPRRVVAATAACALVRREVFAQLGGFDEAFRNGHEDVDFCLRARAAGRTSYVALDSTVAHHVSASPGRGAGKIVNAARSMNRWRGALPALAGEAWSDPHLRARWERRLPWPARLRLRLAPPHPENGFPSGLERLVRRRIDRQLARWQRELGGTLPA